MKIKEYMKVVLPLVLVFIVFHMGFIIFVDVPEYKYNEAQNECLHEGYDLKKVKSVLNSFFVYCDKPRSDTSYYYSLLFGEVAKEDFIISSDGFYLKEEMTNKLNYYIGFIIIGYGFSRINTKKSKKNEKSKKL